MTFLCYDIFNKGGVILIKLNDSHREDFLKCVMKNPTLNLFFIGDYDAYGFDDDGCQYYGIYRKGEMEVCILHFRDSIHLSGNYLNAEEKKNFYDFFKEKKATIFNTSQNFEDIINDFPFESNRDDCLLSVYQDSYEPKLSDSTVELLHAHDYDEFFAVRSDIFSTMDGLEDFKKQHQEKTSISYCVKENGKIVSIATVTAITNDAAMIVGVGTLEAFRQKGYAKKCVQTLINDMMKDNRKTVLFYTNPVAGAMYHKLGFVDQEPYYMLKTV